MKPASLRWTIAVLALFCLALVAAFVAGPARASNPPPPFGGFSALVKMDGVVQYRGHVNSVTENESFFGLQVTIETPGGAFTLYPGPGHLWEITCIQ